MQGMSRTKAGEVSWHTGNVRAATYKEAQYKAEQDFYTNVMSVATNALYAATVEATAKTHASANPSATA